MAKKRNTSIIIKCPIVSAHGPTVLFAAPADELLIAFDARGIVFNDESHAANAELRAQKAIVRHCMEHNVGLELNMDHWNQTQWAYLDAVIGSCGYVKTDDGRKIHGELLRQLEWDDPPRGGGYLVVDPDDETIFKTNHIWY